MLIKDYRAQFIRKLASIYDHMEAESFFYLILEHKHQLRRVDLAMHPDEIFSEKEIQDWDAILYQLQVQIPIQYLLGTAHFYGLTFEVNKNVLIPRPETEELVALIIADNPASDKISILDIGTGSGCIAITLAKNLPNSTVYAIDISEAALAMAKRNAALNDTSVHFMLLDILSVKDLKQTFDIIVSNPPYVRELEKSDIRKNVLDNEPHLALFVADHDALLFYRTIARLAQKNLSPNGSLYFEINQYLGTEMTALLEEMGFENIALRKDLYGNDRMISAVWNSAHS